MINLLALGVATGLSSAFLFAVAATGSPLGLLLSCLAPLPVLIATLGWHHRCGLIASAVGGLAVLTWFGSARALGFTIALALPAWWLGFLALLGRPDRRGTLEWYPLGRLLLWLAAAAAVAASTLLVVGASGDHTAYAGYMRRLLEAFARLHERVPADVPLPGSLYALGGIPTELFIRWGVTAVPLLVAAMYTFLLTVNLWLAAKAVAMSQRLPRPWPFVPAATMPRWAVLLPVGAVAMAAAPGWISVAALALAGALAVAFALQGLALIHEASRGRPARMALLVGVYVLLVLLPHSIMPLLAIAGAVDSAIGLRRFMHPGAAPPPRT